MHEVMIGRHAFGFEPPDLLRAEIHGAVSAEEMARFAAYTRARAGECASLLVLADVSDMGDVSADARKEARAAVGVRFGGTALYGASFQRRMVVTLVMSALRLLSGDENNPLVFFGTEAEARRWIAARRHELARAASTHGPSR